MMAHAAEEAAQERGRRRHHRVECLVERVFDRTP
jgi:hypothetical protein